MEILITYDINTEDKAGKRRLRRVAQTCEKYGQRVQYSVFECDLDQAQLEVLMHRIEKLIDKESDSVRFYRLREPRDRYLRVIGHELAHDLHEPLVL